MYKERKGIRIDGRCKKFIPINDGDVIQLTDINDWKSYFVIDEEFTVNDLQTFIDMYAFEEQDFLCLGNINDNPKVLEKIKSFEEQRKEKHDTRSFARALINVLERNGYKVTKKEGE